MTALYRTEELRQIESVEMKRLPAGTLMERAGRAAAQWLDQEVLERPASFIVLCGPGNNGGDGYACARALREMGHAGLCWAPVEPSTDDARGARAAWSAAGGESTPHLPDPGRFDVIVDAMFGIGLTRPLSDPYLNAARWANDSPIEVVALDVPSGLDADSGVWVSGVAGVLAAATVTFLGDKPGLHMSDGCDAAGDVYVESLGIEAPPDIGRLNAPDQFNAILAPRRHNSHKGVYGNVAVIGGDVGMIGAALLAGRAALRLGAGRVYVCCVGAPDLHVDPVCPELMIRTQERLPAVDVAVIGCGLGESEPARRALQLALTGNAPLVVDADALNLIATDDRLRRALREREGLAVVTPHPAEASRLLGGAGALDVSSDRIGAAARLARELHCITVLKGAGTVILDPQADGYRYWVNPTGSPALATAGTGDVLAGMIGALIAQGYGMRAATLAAVWLHGRAAFAHGADFGLLASEIPEIAARELAILRNQR